MSERVKEEIKLLTEWLKLLSVCAIANCSGLISLWRIERKSAAELALIVMGGFTLLGFIIYIVLTHFRIKSKIEGL